MKSNAVSMGLGQLGQGNEVAANSRVGKLKKANHEMQNWLKYKKLTADTDAFLQLSDDTFAEILAIEGIGLAQLPDGEMNDVANGFAEFWRHYLEDTTIITTPFPATTTQQQMFWHERYQQAQDEARRTVSERNKRVWLARQRYSSDRIKAAKAVEDHLQNQEYIIVLFGKSRSELRQLIDNAYENGGQYLQFRKLSRERKQLMLFRINNMNVQV